MSSAAGCCSTKREEEDDNLALIPARGRKEGIDHFGFEVENIRETGRIALEAGASSGLSPATP
ncbi:MAG TPA: hypothetical protein VFB73_05025 [Chloroflexota bacterium]|nr:hypothetical protein [Chloroflexota bacterium]